MAIEWVSNFGLQGGTALGDPSATPMCVYYAFLPSATANDLWSTKASPPSSMGKKLFRV